VLTTSSNRTSGGGGTVIKSDIPTLTETAALPRP
jgi:hypothetical protein